MFGDSLTVADTLLISGFSILSVFLVLLLLSYMIDFCAFLVKRSENLTGNRHRGLPLHRANDSSDVLLAAAAVAACLSVEPDDIVVQNQKSGRLRRYMGSKCAFGVHTINNRKGELKPWE